MCDENLVDQLNKVLLGGFIFQENRSQEFLELNQRTFFHTTFHFTSTFNLTLFVMNICG